MASKLVELAPDLDAWLMKAEAQTRVNPQERFVVFSRFCATWRMRAWDVWDFQTFLEGRVGSRVILLARESLRNITGTPVAVGGWVPLQPVWARQNDHSVE